MPRRNIANPAFARIAIIKARSRTFQDGVGSVHLGLLPMAELVVDAHLHDVEQ